VDCAPFTAACVVGGVDILSFHYNTLVINKTKSRKIKKLTDQFIVCPIFRIV